MLESDSDRGTGAKTTRYLDTYADTHQAFLSEGDFSGQYWRVDGVVDSPPAPPPTPPQVDPVPIPVVVTKPRFTCNPPTYCECSHLVDLVYFISLQEKEGNGCGSEVCVTYIPAQSSSASTTVRQFNRIRVSWLEAEIEPVLGRIADECRGG